MQKNIFALVDIGGTKILLLLAAPGRKVLFKEKYSTPREREPHAMAAALSASLSQALENSGVLRDDLAGLGICIAALVDYHKGVIHQAPNLGWFEPVPFRDLLQKEWPCPVFIENDANAAVVGEVYYGAARGHRDVIYVTVSTGIGGGFFLDGKLYRGCSGFAGEIGHTKPFGQGRQCNCGGMDCLEAWAAGTAIARRAAALMGDETKNRGEINTAWVFDQAEAGNLRARALIAETGVTLGIGLANLVTLLNPSCLVVGGGVAGNRASFLAQVWEQVKKSAIAPAVEVTRPMLVAAELEPEAGIWGMYALMNNELKTGGL